MTSVEKLSYLLKKNKGFLKTSDAVSSGISRTVLGDFVRKNGLERVAHGLYMSQDAWEDNLFVIQVRYPESVFSHETALYLLNLANREPSPFSVTLRTGTNSARLSKEGIKVYKVKEALFDQGIIETISPSGHTVRTYNAERTICDLFRSRRNIEIQALQDAVKTYVHLRDKNIPLLMRYAKLFSVEKMVRQYLDVLL
ncbi:type IV toxin-antitoxin system AbiEi family antitoxin domain-containing protein [Anoxynatronum buryatiense]|uniref:Transcriptional regulator, AbiEi antitoxin, Type IV TA system n=1 Tax=Anoxynatronum buryatiense TaxID=489973 RepID=A0AA45WXX9_9CLOT|nr:type IV toxin-antitoxin system AbiEi family antitoxin domain-containing protein [Anoxynatronum buryatiense]SMP64366.1 Transcriptional regulator, AbiEi antitoxin, Type IV TA system [Anoxynatronum buryatiense]